MHLLFIESLRAFRRAVLCFAIVEASTSTDLRVQGILRPFGAILVHHGFVWVYLGAFGRQDGPKMPARWPQDSPQRLQDDSKRLQDGTKRGQDGPNKPQDASPSKSLSPWGRPPTSKMEAPVKPREAAARLRWPTCTSEPVKLPNKAENQMFLYVFWHPGAYRRLPGSPGKPLGGLRKATREAPGGPQDAFGKPRVAPGRPSWATCTSEHANLPK